jgi:hypothetical protein
MEGHQEKKEKFDFDLPNSLTSPFTACRVILFACLKIVLLG